MINLIPNEEKKKMFKDFYFRLATLVFVLLSVSIFVGSISMLPSYFSSSVEKGFFEERLALQNFEAANSTGQNMSITVEDLKNRLNLIERETDNNFLSERVINKIISKRIEGIKINEISYQLGSSGEEKINVNGNALSREILLSFRLSFEKDQSFSKVDLPISNFVKGSDIEFSLTLILKPEN